MIDSETFARPIGRDVNPTATTEEQRETKVAALLREREGYAVRGKDDRIAAVDVELARLGAAPVEPSPAATPKARAAKRPARATAKGRKAEKRG